MTLVMNWLEQHAIDPLVAKDCGLWATSVKGEDTQYLHAPYLRADGSKFDRVRKFPGGDWLQPRGEALACWWPLGRGRGGSVLLCEGEGDTLAAASILDKTDHEHLNGLCPVGMPGVGAVKVAAEEFRMARVKHCYICLDADEPGRRATEKLCELLPMVGVTPFPVDLSRSGAKDLAEALRACAQLDSLPLNIKGGETFLAGRITHAKPSPIQRPPRRPSEPLSASEESLKDIPAPAWIAALCDIEQPRIGQLINCPLPDHDDSTPSMRVMENWFYCHGCGVGGSIFDFEMAMSRCSFPEAKENLLARFDGAGSTPIQTTSLTNA